MTNRHASVNLKAHTCMHMYVHVHACILHVTTLRGQARWTAKGTGNCVMHAMSKWLHSHSHTHSGFAGRPKLALLLGTLTLTVIMHPPPCDTLSFFKSCHCVYIYIACLQKNMYKFNIITQYCLYGAFTITSARIKINY